MLPEPSPQPQAAPKTARFTTRALLPTDTLVLVLYLLASILFFMVAVALTPNGAWRVAATVCLTLLPVGGYLLFAFLLERRISYEITSDGIWRRIRPARRFTMVHSSRTLYEWNHIADYTADEQSVLGRFGFLEIGLREPAEVLWITPARKTELVAFRAFVTAFANEVAALNQDETPRAVAVSQIGRRPSLFERRSIKWASIALAVVVVATLVRDVLDPPPVTAIASRVYLYLIAVPAALYCVRRSYPRWGQKLA